MRRDPRAVLFDLDDTLCPRMRFVRSGFRAVAGHAAARWGIDADRGFAVLSAASRHQPGRELQALVARFALPADAVGTLVAVIRAHRPTMRLPRTAATALARLRDGWRLAVVTNGLPDVQARKIEALGLTSLVDAVVFACATGDGTGKPAAAPFVEACLRLGVAPSQAVFVGDDVRCDVEGARRAGMKTIWVRSPRAGGSAAADMTLPSVARVPEAAECLIPGSWSPHAA
jgi:HAD superfamily hydrolase (TIGR01509 family)